MARLEQAVAIKPDVARGHKSLGNTLKLQGEFDRARPASSKRWTSIPTTSKRITIA